MLFSLTENGSLLGPTWFVQSTSSCLSLLVTLSRALSQRESTDEPSLGTMRCVPCLTFPEARRQVAKVLTELLGLFRGWNASRRDVRRDTSGV